MQRPGSPGAGGEGAATRRGDEDDVARRGGAAVLEGHDGGVGEVTAPLHHDEQDALRRDAARSCPSVVLASRLRKAMAGSTSSLRNAPGGRGDAPTRRSRRPSSVRAAPSPPPEACGCRRRRPRSPARSRPRRWSPRGGRHCPRARRQCAPRRGRMSVRPTGRTHATRGAAIRRRGRRIPARQVWLRSAARRRITKPTDGDGPSLPSRKQPRCRRALAGGARAGRVPYAASSRRSRGFT